MLEGELLEREMLNYGILHTESPPQQKTEKCSKAKLQFQL